MALTGLIINEADAIQAGLADAFLPGSARDALLEGCARSRGAAMRDSTVPRHAAGAWAS
ncbi:MAG: hypothetical protein R3E48_14910 [Burkholderiaceae bacterium]